MVSDRSKCDSAGLFGACQRAPILTKGRPFSATLAKEQVAATALFVAAVRARETKRNDPLLRDDLSLVLAGPEGPERLASSERDPASNYHKDSSP